MVTALIFILALSPADLADEQVKVTVVAIVANSDPADGKIDPQLESIAAEVKKKYPQLTGFHLKRMTCTSMTVGKEDTFKTVDDLDATVTVQQGSDKHDRVRLTIKPPQVKEITYTTCCGKFFPVVTPYLTKDKQEQLIIAVRVSTCKDK
jgi:hypothetical protein